MAGRRSKSALPRRPGVCSARADRARVFAHALRARVSRRCRTFIKRRSTGLDRVLTARIGRAISRAARGAPARAGLRAGRRRGAGLGNSPPDSYHPGRVCSRIRRRRRKSSSPASGPVDDSVNVLVARDVGDGRIVAMVVNATCHPVHEMCIPQISADFPGVLAAARTIASRLRRAVPQRRGRQHQPDDRLGRPRRLAPSWPGARSRGRTPAREWHDVQLE